jgi:hypothetical protein
MPSENRQLVTFSGLTGRDGSTPSEIAIPPTRCKEAVNVDFYQAAFARKRDGSSAVFDSTTSEAFTGILSTLIRHVPGANDAAAELWGIDNASTPVVQRLTGGTVWATPTLKDNIATLPQDVVGASLNGKLFLAFDSTQDRLHVWDASTVRRAGLGTPAAPAVADTGSGSYAANTRYYKVAYAVSGSGVNNRRSELSSAQGFTPSGSGTHARVTKPAALNEGESHWLLYGSGDNATYYLLSTIAVGTTTYDDNGDPSTYTGDAPALAGEMTVQVSPKYILSAGNRLLSAGSYESGNFNSRVWFTPVIGDLDVGDDERVPDTTVRSNYIDLDENDGGFITGMGGPLEGSVWVFKYRQIWQLVPTGEVSAPYDPTAETKALGAIRHQTIVNAEDEHGDPAMYFLSHKGPYRIGRQGIQKMRDDVLDIWTTVNLDATVVSAFGVYYPDLNQVWFWISVSSGNTPTRILVFDTTKGRTDEKGDVRGGWSLYNGHLAASRCATMFANTLGSSMSRDLKPYVGYSTGAKILKGGTGTNDAGTNFQSYVDLPEQHFGGIGQKCQVDQAIILGSAGSHTIRITVNGNYTDTTRVRTADVTMTAVGSQTRVLKVWEDAQLSDDLTSVGIRVGDSTAVSNAWTIDGIGVQVRTTEPTAP